MYLLNFMFSLFVTTSVVSFLYHLPLVYAVFFLCPIHYFYFVCFLCSVSLQYSMCVYFSYYFFYLIFFCYTALLIYLSVLLLTLLVIHCYSSLFLRTKTLACWLPSPFIIYLYHFTLRAPLNQFYKLSFSWWNVTAYPCNIKSLPLCRVQSHRPLPRDTGLQETHIM
jgi:hypothetical protein